MRGRRFANIILRFGVSLVFFYFGILAVLNPQVEAAQWIQNDIYASIEAVMSIAIFMTAFGALQIVIAAGILFKKMYRWALLAAGLLLVGIIVNLGIAGGSPEKFVNDVNLRDFVILTAVINLYLTRRG